MTALWSAVGSALSGCGVAVGSPSVAGAGVGAGEGAKDSIKWRRVFLGWALM
jgi:hypothetical protein